MISPLAYSYKHCFDKRQLEQRSLDGLYIKIWIERLQVPTEVELEALRRV